MLQREPKTVAWLKQHIKNLPDDYTICFLDHEGNRHAIFEVAENQLDQSVILVEGLLTAEIEPLLRMGKKIAAVKLYREFTRSSLMESKLAVEEIQRQLGLGQPKLDISSYPESIQEIYRKLGYQ